MTLSEVELKYEKEFLKTLELRCWICRRTESEVRAAYPTLKLVIRVVESWISIPVCQVCEDAVFYLAHEGGIEE